MMWTEKISRISLNTKLATFQQDMSAFMRD